MHFYPIKHHRILRGLEKQQIAENLGVSLEIYERWEAGEKKIPQTKLRKLANLLSTTIDELKDKPFPLEAEIPGENILEEQQYYGQIAIHFCSGSPLIMPISETARGHLHDYFSDDSKFFRIESMDNRLAFVRKEAIASISLSSEAFEPPDDEIDSDGVFVMNDDRFWCAMENIEALEDADIPKDCAESFLTWLGISKEEIPDIFACDIESLDSSTPDGAKKRMIASLYRKATEMVVQYSNGRISRDRILDEESLYDSFYEINADDMTEKFVFVPIEGHHRALIINLDCMDFIAIPKHKFNCGWLLSTENCCEKGYIA